MTSGEDFWEQREQVEHFAAREPDVRLARLIAEYPDPAAVRVLDLGCAGGRNTVLLAQRGFDVWAVDSSHAMVEKTRARLSLIVGPGQARLRVRRGAMDRLDGVEAASVDLLVALGVYHCASRPEQWTGALSESARVLKIGGRCLVSVFTPETDLTGQGLRRSSLDANVYEGFPGGQRSYLVDAPSLDREMSRHGLSTVGTTVTARREAGPGRRVSANGLYVRYR